MSSIISHLVMNSIIGKDEGILIASGNGIEIFSLCTISYREPRLINSVIMHKSGGSKHTPINNKISRQSCTIFGQLSSRILGWRRHTMMDDS
jgi:hypothetical protein